ncbi:MAG: hypothetical protein M3R58_05335 [Pseudomonadota bacterium]|nr:hypothetical protein [Pseudomonadota bacterium]
MKATCSQRLATASSRRSPPRGHLTAHLRRMKPIYALTPPQIRDGVRRLAALF